MRDEAKAEAFAAALTDLCHRHGVMIWTAVAATTPIMGTDVGDYDDFHYKVERFAFGEAFIIRRVLADAP